MQSPAGAERGGIARSVARLPVTVPFVAPEEIERRRGEPFALRLGANESAFGPSPRALEAAERELGRVPWYGDPRSHRLRERLAGTVGRRREEVLVGSGIDDLIGLVVRCTIDPGAVAVASAGTYPTFAYHVRAHSGELRTVPYGEGHAIDLDALAEAAVRDRAGLVYVANPDNPSGTMRADAELVELARALPPACTLLLDEAYRDFVLPPAPEGSDPANLIRLRTFSKGHALAGLRVGYALAAGPYIEAFDKVRLHFGVNRIAQAAALASLDDEAHLRAVVEAVDEERPAHERAGREAGWVPIPSRTNFVAFVTDGPGPARRWVEDLESRGVFVRRGSAPPFDACVRVTIGTAEQRRRLEGVLAEVGRLHAVGDAAGAQA